MKTSSKSPKLPGQCHIDEEIPNFDPNLFQRSSNRSDRSINMDTLHIANEEAKDTIGNTILTRFSGDTMQQSLWPSTPRKVTSRRSSLTLKDRKHSAQTSGDEPLCVPHSERLDDITFSLSRNGLDVGDVVQETWPVDHVRVLYMLSRYASCAKTPQDRESWIRQIPLLVLMYEGIAAGVLNFDYAPAALVIAQDGRPKRIWINTSQDGKSAIDDLREANLVNGLKLSTRDYHSVTAFQVSLRGFELLQQVGKDLKHKVDEFIFAPKPYRRELLQIRYIPFKMNTDPKNASVSTLLSLNTKYSLLSRSEKHLALRQQQKQQENEAAELTFNEEGKFILESIGYFRYSQVTETEDVSYVSSPFIPECVRNAKCRRALSSNAHRNKESAHGQSNIRDALSEAIVLSNAVCIIGEWIPFGSNQIIALNERLGSMDRCQGGLFTSLIDDRPTDTQFEVPPGLTQVRILDYDPARYINFEAEIHFPEDDGIVQIENFGIHLHVDGTIFYGIHVDAIMDQLSDSISVDLLSRLLVDIHQDSSEIMDDLLSSYQTSLLDVTYLGDVANRGKFNLIFADEIYPFMPSNEYLDRGDYENELKQILGDLHCAFGIGEESLLMLGREGILIVGPASRRFESLLVSYFSLLCREMFLRSFFNRIFVLQEHLKEIRNLILHTKEDPNHVSRIRSMLSQSTNDLILFTDTLGYLLESLEIIKIPVKSSDPSEEEEAIYGVLKLDKQHEDILSRARDLEKLVHGAKYEITNLRQMAEVLNTTQLQDIFRNVESNTKQLDDASNQVLAEAKVSLESTCYLLAASFAFTIADRVYGGTLGLHSVPTWIQKSIISPISEIPMLLFLLNILWMLLFVFVLFQWKQHVDARNSKGHHVLRIKMNKNVDMTAYHKFLSTRPLEKQESYLQPTSELRRVMWYEKPGYGQPYTEKQLKVRSRSSRKSLTASGLIQIQSTSIRAWRARIVKAFNAWIETMKKRSRQRAAVEVAAEAAKNAAANVAIVGVFGTSNASENANGSNSSSSTPSALALVSSAATAAALLRSKIGPHPIQIEIEYDSHIEFLLNLTFHIHLQNKQSSIQNGFMLWHSIRSLWSSIKGILKISTAFSTNSTTRQRHRSPRIALPLKTDSPELSRNVRKRGQVAPGTPNMCQGKFLELEQEVLIWFAHELKEHRVIPSIDVIL
uniref:Uncharacterized protein AlNc14C206G8811 n=1 Tax=Albugo laibachii Nc14 TaxID=890382 RepID=F0WR03_9STRA|nr:conserved hypothetical protein [Albugo laibachii Nc14]|eukprot:CCA23763.1 conserved hypothetical protein [Albugo laibachii Nc14]